MLLPESLQERRRRHCCNTFTSDVVDVVLALLHAVHVLLEGDALDTGFGSLVLRELSDLDSVGGRLVDSKLNAFAELQ